MKHFKDFLNCHALIWLVIVLQRHFVWNILTTIHICKIFGWAIIRGVVIVKQMDFMNFFILSHKFHQRFIPPHISDISIFFSDHFFTIDQRPESFKMFNTGSGLWFGMGYCMFQCLVCPQ